MEIHEIFKKYCFLGEKNFSPPQLPDQISYQHFLRVI